MKRAIELAVIIGLLASLVQLTSRKSDSPSPKASPVTKTEKDTGTDKPFPNAPLLNKSLRIDGVGVGMSYSEVLNILGKPNCLGWEGPAVYFLYSSEQEPATTVWFSDGKSVFCSGAVLSREGRVIYTSGQPAERLLKEFGPSEELNYSEH